VLALILVYVMDSAYAWVIQGRGGP
jgi:hypothetical protein